MSLDTRPPESIPDNITADTTVVMIRIWTRRLLVPLAILAWGVLLYCTLVLAGHVVQTLIFIAIAVVIAYALGPTVAWLQYRLHVPRWLAILIAYLVFAALLGAFFYVIANTVTSELPAFGAFIRTTLNNSQVQGVLTRIGLSPSSLSLGGGGNGGLVSNIASIAGNIVPVVTGVANGAIGIIVILVLSIYFVAAGPHVGHWLRTQTPITHRTRVIYLLDTMNRVVGGYIRGQVTMAALVGMFVGLGMHFLFHLPFAALLGLVAFVLEFIPFLGVIVSGAACVLVALTQGIVTALLVIGYFAIVHVLEGDVIGPRIVGRFVGLHPAVALIALVAGAELFGIWGALFASPVAGLVQALLQTVWTEYRRANRDLFPDDTASSPVTDGQSRPPGSGTREPAAKRSHGLRKPLGGFFLRGGKPAPGTTSSD